MWRCHVFCDGTIILRRLHKVNSFLQENSFLLHFYSYNHQDMPFLCIFNTNSQPQIPCGSRRMPFLGRLRLLFCSFYIIFVKILCTRGMNIHCIVIDIYGGKPLFFRFFRAFLVDFWAILYIFSQKVCIYSLFIHCINIHFCTAYSFLDKQEQRW